MGKVRNIDSDVLNCKSCDLFYSRTRPVGGKGNTNATVMIIGEAPGRKEDLEGVPFVGRSGVLLEKIINHAGLNREDLYITNAVKCKPPVGRTPSTSQIKKCSPFLEREIEFVKPSIIVPMGNSALRAISEIFSMKLGKISEVNGKIIRVKDILLIPQFHPAAILRNPKKLEMFKDNFVLIAKYVMELKERSMESFISRYDVREVPA